MLAPDMHGQNIARILCETTACLCPLWQEVSYLRTASDVCRPLSCSIDSGSAVSVTSFLIKGEGEGFVESILKLLLFERSSSGHADEDVDEFPLVCFLLRDTATTKGRMRKRCERKDEKAAKRGLPDPG